MNFQNKSIGKATRPIFIPNIGPFPKIHTLNIDFDWHMGMSYAVKQRSMQSLHQAAMNNGFAHILEASSKSEHPIGIHLSAFYLKNHQSIPVENLFQSSKVFELGGPFLDLLFVTPKEAKRDTRLKNHGSMIKFQFQGFDFPLEPKSLFYDWLYIKTLNEPQNQQLRHALINENFQAFSDIEFNPKKSFSCQARTLALYITLFHSGLVDEFLNNPVQMVHTYNLYSNIQYEEPSTGNYTLF